MGTTIDHLRIDHRINVLQDFVDANCIAMQAGDTGILRKLSYDQIKDLIHMEIECDTVPVSLTFDLRAVDGPRNGHMREFFELGEDVTPPRNVSVPLEPVVELQPKPTSNFEGTIEEPGVEGPDRLVDYEDAMTKKYNDIGVATSIAEMYAQRMRAFRRLGNEPRAIAAFKLANDWMGTYASWATSGGEGVANSRERDRFRASLVAEFGYDPEASESKA